MSNKLVLALFIVIFSGCAGESRYTKIGNQTFELAMDDTGIMSMLNTSRLEQEWNNEAEKLCPKGYTVKNQTYFPEKSFEPARLIGTITCKLRPKTVASKIHCQLLSAVVLFTK